MIDLSAYPILNSHMSALKDTSIDKRDNHTEKFMTESERPAVNFDQVKEEYVECLGLSEIPKSNDALLEDGKGGLVFVEFKNGYMDKKKQFDVRKKIYDSVLIFSDIVSAGISDMRKYVEYILVYNEKVNAGNPEIVEEKKKHVQPSASFDCFAKEVSGLAGEEYVSFGVKIFENYCFKKVHTYTEKEFEKYLNCISASRAASV